MRISRVARRYARALFNAAMDNDALERVQADLELILKEYLEHAEFQRLMDSPVIANREKLKLFGKIFRGRIGEVTFNFFTLLFEKNREQLFVSITEHYKELLDEHKGIIRGEIYAPLPLSEEQVSRVKKYLDQMTGKNVILTPHIDESLLGGFVVRIQDQIIDISLKNQLQKLRKLIVSA